MDGVATAQLEALDEVHRIGDPLAQLLGVTDHIGFGSAGTLETGMLPLSDRQLLPECSEEFQGVLVPGQFAPEHRQSLHDGMQVQLLKLDFGHGHAPVQAGILLDTQDIGGAPVASSDSGAHESLKPEHGKELRGATKQLGLL